jgi:hypothetical protein
MPNAPTPWIGLAALVAMFALPFLPTWLFEGPRTVRHRPRRHVCADCAAPWTSDHDCAVELRRLGHLLRAELHRLDDEPAALLPRRDGEETGIATLVRR